MSGERVEAQFTVPASTTASVSNGAQSAASTITMTAGTTYMTSFVSDLQTQLNATIGNQPRTATALQVALGYGTATGGWLCEEASGNLAPTIGAVTLTANGTPTYLNAGIGQGNDHAVGFGATSAYFDGGANFDVGANDLLVAAIVKFSAATTSTIVSKAAAALASGWVVYFDGTNVLVSVVDGGGTKTSFVTAASFLNEWCALLACVDRSTGKLRIGLRGLTSGTTSLGTETTVSGNITTAATFRMGADAWLGTASTATVVSGLYVGTGASAASGLSANMSSALLGLANAAASAFLVTLSASTGKVTISHTVWPSYVTFNDATFRDSVGFAYDFDYPSTAAQLAAAVGYGTWTSGAAWLCNEASGNLAPAFGSPSLTPNSSPTYGTLGPRSGADKAIGFDSINDAFFGGDVFNIAATSDFALLWVAYFTSAASNPTVISKYSGAAGKWWVGIDTATGKYFLQGINSGGSSDFIAYSGVIPLNCWHVGIATIDRATGKASVGVCQIGGSPLVGTEVTATATAYSNAANFSIGDRGDLPGGAPQNGKIAYAAIVTGTSVATGMSANLSTALTNFATYMKSQTGTLGPIGLWYPGCNFVADSDPKQAPKGDNCDAQVAPDGSVYSLAGTTYYRHRNCRFPRVSKTRVWENDATLSGATWQTFYLETQLGQHSWFSARSRVKVYWDNGGTVTELGSGGVSGWKMANPTKLDELVIPVKGWTGLVEITLGDLYSAG